MGLCRPGVRAGAAAVLVLGCVVPVRPQEPVATFKSGVDLVTVSAVVRDRNGRLVPSLQSQDFELLDAGQPRTITGFRAEESPISLAVLLDVSGSMDVGYKVSAAGQAAHHLLSWLQPGIDEVALFTFDTELDEVVPFSSDPVNVLNSLDQVRPFGATSIRDAIAAAARRVVERGRLRRAVVVLTDGVDTASQLTAPEVSGIASAIDVPVYILGVISPLDHAGAKDALADQDPDELAGELTDLARWTGGALFVASAPAHTSLAARQIVTELRHQYLIVFEPSAIPGWHPLELRTRDPDLTVRARSGYFAGGARPVG